MSKTKRTKMQQEGKENKVAVMGLAEREGRVRLTVIGKDSFKEVVRKNVDTKAILITDEHNGYKGLQNEYNGHVTVNHSQFVFVQDGFSTNNVEGMFSQLKRMVIGIYHQISPAHLHRFCDEASYRYNTRKIKDVDRFHDAMSKTTGRLRYIDLVQPKAPTYTGIEFVNEE
jgi:ISXO2-like transposase domain